MVKDINEGKGNEDGGDMKRILISKIQNQHKKPGQFRSKDLTILFEQCERKLKQFHELKEEKERLEERVQEREKQWYGYREEEGQGDQEVYQKMDKIQVMKKKQYKYRYKYKCEIRDCGKVMLSQSAYQRHMKKKHAL